MAQPDYSVVIPCLNEAETIGKCVRAVIESFDEMGIEGEILVADNASSDDSAEFARAAGARVISAPERGYGGAVKAGISAAVGKFVLVADGDMSYDFSVKTLRSYFDNLENGADLVLGNRTPVSPFKRFVTVSLGSFLLRIMFGRRIRDISCGMRGVNKQSYRKWNVQIPGKEFASEMVVKAILQKSVIVEVPTPFNKPQRSRYRKLKDSFRHLNLWVKMFWKYRIRKSGT